MTDPLEQKLQPHETALNQSLRIEWLTTHYLKKISVGEKSGGWEILFQDPDDGRYWEKTYPQSEMHGGGSPQLRHLTIQDAENKYGKILNGRLAARFAALKAKKQSGLVTFITAGDPDLETFAKILAGLPKAGADIIEIGVPFSDPMADGLAIQAANTRAFKAGISLKETLHMVQQFRKTDAETPIVLMGYYNPVYVYGVENFLKDAKSAGVDGLIVVDLPPEEDSELCEPAQRHGLNFIRLVTPTTDGKRLPAVLKNASGFLYYVSVTGITGTKVMDAKPVQAAITELRKHTALPVAVGFGITTPDQAKAVAQFADAAVVGSAIINRIAANLDASGKAKPGLVDEVLGFVGTLAKAAHSR